MIGDVEIACDFSADRPHAIVDSAKIKINSLDDRQPGVGEHRRRDAHEDVQTWSVRLEEGDDFGRKTMRERDTGREGGPRAGASQNEPTKAHDGHSLPPRHARIPSPLRRRDGGRMTCRVIARLCLVIGVLAYGTAADAQVLQGLSLFQQHCAACHAAPSADSRAPNRDALRDLYA